MKQIIRIILCITGVLAFGFIYCQFNALENDLIPFNQAVLPCTLSAIYIVIAYFVQGLLRQDDYN